MRRKFIAGYKQDMGNIAATVTFLGIRGMLYVYIPNYL